MMLKFGQNTNFRNFKFLALKSQISEINSSNLDLDMCLAVKRIRNEFWRKGGKARAKAIFTLAKQSRWYARHSVKKKSANFTLNREIFRENNLQQNFVLDQLISRNFSKDKVKVNFRNFNTVSLKKSRKASGISSPFQDQH